MALLRDATPAAGTRAFTTCADLQAPADEAFNLLCSVEKWPLWLPFLRSAERGDSGPLERGSEILLRSSIPGEREQLFEVDQFIQNYHLSLVGAYSVRRRLDFRIERKTTYCKLHARLQYPAYGGRLGMLLDEIRAGRRLAGQLENAAVHFKHLAEYAPQGERLEDF